jgi:hypothetical protein
MASIVTSVLVLSIVLLGSTVYAATPAASVASTSTSCVPAAYPFAVTGTGWGTSGAPPSVGPGGQNVPLTVTLLYTGGCAVTAASFELNLSQPLVGTNGASNLTTYEVNLASDAVFSETYYVDVMSNASLETYVFPMQIGYNTSSFTGIFFQTLNVSIALKGTVDLSFTSNVSYLYAGTVNEVKVSITNSGSGDASLISPVVTTLGQVSILNQLSDITRLSPNSTTTRTLQVFVPSSLLGSTTSITLSASYYDAYSISRSATQSLGFYVTGAKPSTPFVIETSAWGSTDSTPQPGDRNVPLVLTVQYLGTSTATSLQATLSLPAGFTNQNGGSTSTAYGAMTNPDQTVELTFYLNVASSDPAGSYTFPLVLTWSTAFTSGLNQSLTASPPAIGQPPTANTYVLSVTQLSNSVVSGVASTVNFEVGNSGTGTVYSPTFSLSATSPLVVMSNSASPETSLRPGQAETFTAVVSTSPSATPGVYSGTLLAGFTDQSGIQHTQSFSVGFILTGTVELIVQNEQVTQASTGLTVTGSLLNEGGASAYYAQVTGSVRGFPGSNATAYYTGEIDPNSPVSFIITIPLSAPSRAQNAVVLLDIEYKDSFGSIHTVATSSTTSLQSDQQLAASQVTTTTQASSGGDLVSLVSLAVIAAIAIVGVAGAVMVRRRRAAMNPAKKQKEQKII